MKIVAFAGSNSVSSINKELIKFVLNQFEDVEVNFLDLNDFEMPMFSVNLLKQGIHPEKGQEFVNQFDDCDAIICSLAEHNRSFTTAFKNVFDWASIFEKNMFKNKPMFLMSASSEESGGKNVLEHAVNNFPFYGGNIQAIFSLPKFGENFKLEDGLTNPDLSEQLKQEIEAFKMTFVPVS